MKYELIENGKPGEFHRRVNFKLSQHWQLHGPSFMRGENYCQPMTFADGGFVSGTRSECYEFLIKENKDLKQYIQHEQKRHDKNNSRNMRNAMVVANLKEENVELTKQLDEIKEARDHWQSKYRVLIELNGDLRIQIDKVNKFIGFDVSYSLTADDTIDKIKGFKATSGSATFE